MMKHLTSSYFLWFLTWQLYIRYVVVVPFKVIKIIYKAVTQIPYHLWIYFNQCNYFNNFQQILLFQAKGEQGTIWWVGVIKYKRKKVCSYKKRQHLCMFFFFASPFFNFSAIQINNWLHSWDLDLVKIGPGIWLDLIYDWLIKTFFNYKRLPGTILKLKYISQFLVLYIVWK